MPGVDLNPTAAEAPGPPDYDALQRAFHAAFTPELHRILAGLPVPSGGRLLDAPCGGGFYAARLAELADGVGGQVVAADHSPAYFAEARARLAVHANAEVVDADVYRLPFADRSFDLVLCAQSFISLGRPVDALREFRRVLAPGGTLAVLEADDLHHVILPWPVGVEAAIARGVQAANVKRFGDAGRTSPVRRLRAQLAEAGFGAVRRTTHAADFAAPFAPEVAAFLLAHGSHLRETVGGEVAAADRAGFDALTAPDSPAALFRAPGVELALLNVLFTATPGD